MYYSISKKNRWHKNSASSYTHQGFVNCFRRNT